MSGPLNFRSYDPRSVAGFRMTREAFGPFSNMSRGGFEIGGVSLMTSEHYYQAMKFPDREDVQRRVLGATSAKEAKTIARSCGVTPRDDWDRLEVRGNVMRHAIRLKLAFNREMIMAQIDASGDMDIVEISMRDDFWGAIPQPGGELSGRNLLGRLWSELRREVRSDPDAYLRSVPAPIFSRAVLLGAEVGEVEVPYRSVQQTLAL